MPTTVPVRITAGFAKAGFEAILYEWKGPGEGLKAIGV